MAIQFTKMHGLGNDFMVVDLIRQKMPLDSQLIRYLSNRNFGVGFDQMLVVEAPTQRDVDFKYRIFNADGSEVQQCGNGARCFAVFVREKGLTRKSHLVVETMNGIITLDVSDSGWVKVNMGQPRIHPVEIPFTPREDALAPVAINQPSTLYEVEVVNCDLPTVELDVVNMGNPHAVIVVDDVITAEVAKIGAQIESHVRFPERVNVGFMQIMNRNHVRLRVFERGAGETLACGTGACASVVSGIRRGLLDADVTVALQGGQLHIHWEAGDSVWMTGATNTVFEGQFELDDLGY